MQLHSASDRNVFKNVLSITFNRVDDRLRWSTNIRVTVDRAYFLYILSIGLPLFSHTEALMAISSVQGYSSTYQCAKNVLAVDFLTSFCNTFCGKHFFPIFKVLVFLIASNYLLNTLNNGEKCWIYCKCRFTIENLPFLPVNKLLQLTLQEKWDYHLMSNLKSIVSTEDVTCKEIRLLSPKLAKHFVQCKLSDFCIYRYRL